MSPNHHKTIFLSFIMLFITISAQEFRFGDISLPPESFTLGDFLTVNYQINDDNTITMAIQNSIPNQYFGIGWGTSMTGADTWVFEIVDQEVTVKDCWSQGDVEPPLDTVLGGKDNLELLGYEITPTHTLAKVKRALETDDPELDTAIVIGDNNMIYATGPSPIMVYHESVRGVASVILVQTEVVSGEEEAVITEEEYGGFEEEESRIIEEWIIEEEAPLIGSSRRLDEFFGMMMKEETIGLWQDD